MSNDRRLKRVDHADIQIDTQTTARVVESLVLRGDISALNPEERSRFYLQICESLGLTPAALPFAILRLNGKEILYPTRGATDQLAAIHRLNREIVDGPRVVDLAGTKLLYAVCRATHPNGRTETAVATVALSDPLNAMMKVETKAKRRATLSILGLGMLDESELDTIPAHLKSAGAPIKLAQQPDEVSIEPDLPSETEIPPTLASFYADIEQIELPGESIAAWIKHRAELSALSTADREAAWKALCKRCEEVGKMKNAKAWLKRAIAEEDARVGSHDPFNHATTTPAQPSVASDGDAPEATDTPALDALNADLDAIDERGTTLLEAARVWRKHKDAVYKESGSDIDSVYDVQKLVLGVTKISCTRNQLNEHVQAIETRETSRDNVFTDVMDLLELADSAEDVAEIVRKHKPAIDLRAEEIRELLRNVAVRRVQELVPGMADAKQASRWLKNALAPKDPPKPPSGGTPKPDAPAANDSDPERDAIVGADHARENNQFAKVLPAEDRLIAYVASKANVYELQNGLEKHFDEFKPSREQLVRIVVPRLIELSANTMFPLTQMGAINVCRAIYANAKQPKPRKRTRAA